MVMILAKPWKIDSICFDSKRLSLGFNSCFVCWVRQEANNVAHCLIKFGSLHNLSFYYNDSSLTPSVLESWLSDAFSVSGI